MTDFATLALAVDSTQVKAGVAELDKLTDAGGKAETSANKLGKAKKDEAAALGAAGVAAERNAVGLGKAAAEAGKAAAGTQQLVSASGQANTSSQNLTRAKNQEATAMKMAALEAERAAAGLVKASSAAGIARVQSEKLTVAGDAVVKSAGAQRAGMQQLGYQLGDMATMFALGAKPMQIFASQSGQVLGAVQLLTGGTSKLATFLSGPWGIAISVAITALSPFIAKLFETVSAADTARSALQSLIEKQREQAKEAANLTQAQIGLNKTTEQILALEVKIENQRQSNRSRGGRTEAAISQNTAYDQQRLNALRMQQAEGAATVSVAVDKEAAATTRSVKAHEAATPRVKAHTAALGGHAAAVGAVGKAYKGALSEFEQYWAAVDKRDKLFAQAGLSTGEAAFNVEAANLRDTWGEVVDVEERAKAVAEGYSDELTRGGDQLERQIDLVGALVGALGNIGSFGGAGGSIGGLINAFTALDPKTGKPSKDSVVAGLLGMGGPLGIGAAFLLKPDLFKQYAGDISGGFEALGMGKGMSGVLGRGLAGAGIGSVFGGITGSSTGGAIGGAIGGQFSQTIAKAVGGTLGSVLGAAVPVIGGLLGGLIGKLFSKTTKGSAFISNTGVSTSGNNQDLIGQVGQLGSNLQGSINQIAQALGVDVGSYNVAIAQRSSGYIHVDAAGSANVGDQNWIKSAGANALYNGKDMAEAMKAAFRNAVEDGAFKGLSETIKRLLLTGDIDAQVQKAVTLQTALKAAVFEADPLGEALKAVAKEMDNLRAIAQEAGATEAETAQIEELAAAKRKAVLDAAGQFIEDNFYSDAEKLAKAAGAVDDVFAKLNITNVTTREQFRDLVKGIDLTSEAGTKLYSELLKIAPQFLMVTQAVDLVAQAAAELERQAAAQAAAVAAQKTDLQIRLLEALGEKEAALALRRSQGLQAIDESLRGLQAAVYWAEDVSKARDVLSASYKRERNEIEATAKKYRDHADALRTYRQSLFGNDVGAAGYAQTLAKLKSAGAMAALGDEASSSALPGLGKTFLDASRGQAKTAADYQRDVARVAGIVDKAIAGNDSMANAADQQAKMLEASVQGLIDLNEGVTSTTAAIADLRKLLDEPTVSIADSNIKQVDVLTDIRVELNRLRSDGSATAEDMRIALTTISGALARVASVLTAADGGGAINVRTDGTDTVKTVAA